MHVLAYLRTHVSARSLAARRGATLIFLLLSILGGTARAEKSGLMRAPTPTPTVFHTPMAQPTATPTPYHPPTQTPIPPPPPPVTGYSITARTLYASAVNVQYSSTQGPVNIYCGLGCAAYNITSSIKLTFYSGFPISFQLNGPAGASAGNCPAQITQPAYPNVSFTCTVPIVPLQTVFITLTGSPVVPTATPSPTPTWTTPPTATPTAIPTPICSTGLYTAPPTLASLGNADLQAEWDAMGRAGVQRGLAACSQPGMSQMSLADWGRAPQNPFLDMVREKAKVAGRADRARQLIEARGARFDVLALALLTPLAFEQHNRGLTYFELKALSWELGAAARRYCNGYTIDDCETPDGVARHLAPAPDAAVARRYCRALMDAYYWVNERRTESSVDDLYLNLLALSPSDQRSLNRSRPVDLSGKSLVLLDAVSGDSGRLVTVSEKNADRKISLLRFAAEPAAKRNAVYYAFLSERPITFAGAAAEDLLRLSRHFQTYVQVADGDQYYKEWLQARADQTRALAFVVLQYIVDRVNWKDPEVLPYLVTTFSYPLMRTLLNEMPPDFSLTMREQAILAQAVTAAGLVWAIRELKTAGLSYTFDPATGKPSVDFADETRSLHYYRVQGMPEALDILGLSALAQDKRGPVEVGDKYILPPIPSGPLAGYLPIVDKARFDADLAKYRDAMAYLKARKWSWTDVAVESFVPPSPIVLTDIAGDPAYVAALELVLPGLYANLADKSRTRAFLAGDYMFPPMSNGKVYPVTKTSYELSVRQWLRIFERGRNRLFVYYSEQHGLEGAIKNWETWVKNYANVWNALGIDQTVNGLTLDEAIRNGAKQDILDALAALRRMGCDPEIIKQLDYVWGELLAFEAKVLNATRLNAILVPTVGLVAALVAPKFVIGGIVLGVGYSGGKQAVQIYVDRTRTTFDSSELWASGLSGGMMGPIARIPGVRSLAAVVGAIQLADDSLTAAQKGQNGVAVYDAVWAAALVFPQLVGKNGTGTTAATVDYCAPPPSRMLRPAPVKSPPQPSSGSFGPGAFAEVSYTEAVCWMPSARPAPVPGQQTPFPQLQKQRRLVVEELSRPACEQSYGQGTHCGASGINDVLTPAEIQAAGLGTGSWTWGELTSLEKIRVDQFRASQVKACAGEAQMTKVAELATRVGDMPKTRFGSRDLPFFIPPAAGEQLSSIVDFQPIVISGTYAFAMPQSGATQGSGSQSGTTGNTGNGTGTPSQGPECVPAPIPALDATARAAAVKKATSVTPIYPEELEGYTVHFITEDAVENQQLFLDRRFEADIQANPAIKDEIRNNDVATIQKYFDYDTFASLVEKEIGKLNDGQLAFTLFRDAYEKGQFEENETILIERWAAKNIVYFSPGHGHPGGRHYVAGSHRYRDLPKSYIRVQLDMSPVWARVANSRAVQSVQTIFYASCNAGLDGPGSLSSAQRLANASCKKVIAPMGVLDQSYYGRQNTFYVTVKVPGPDGEYINLPRDEAFRVFVPNAPSRPITFEEVLSLVSDKSAGRTIYSGD